MQSGPEPFLRITEIFHSVQGESTWAGLPCTFVRITGCPLRCVWCDTEYAFTGGTRMELDEIVDAVREHGCDLVEVTGGEPLAHANAFPLIERLLDEGFTVLVEMQTPPWLRSLAEPPMASSNAFSFLNLSIKLTGILANRRLSNSFLPYPARNFQDHGHFSSKIKPETP